MRVSTERKKNNTAEGNCVQNNGEKVRRRNGEKMNCKNKANQIKIIWKFIHLSQSNEHWGGWIHEGCTSNDIVEGKMTKRQCNRNDHRLCVTSKTTNKGRLHSLSSRPTNKKAPTANIKSCCFLARRNETPVFRSEKKPHQCATQIATMVLCDFSMRTEAFVSYCLCGCECVRFFNYSDVWNVYMQAFLPFANWFTSFEPNLSLIFFRRSLALVL